MLANRLAQLSDQFRTFIQQQLRHFPHSLGTSCNVFGSDLQIDDVLLVRIMTGRRLRWITQRLVVQTWIVGKFIQRLEKLIRIDGFRHVAVHACIQASFAVTFHGTGGHGNDGNVFSEFLFLLADRRRGFEAVHFRHHAIQ